MSQIFSLGLIGTSAIAREAAIAAACSGSFRVAAVLSRQVDTAEQFCELLADQPQLPGLAQARLRLQAFTNQDDFFAAVDVVYIASPNTFHYRQAKAALLAGKHVIVEKPAVLEPQHWLELVQLAEDKGLVIVEAMRHLFEASTLALVQTAGNSKANSVPETTCMMEFKQRSSRWDKYLAGQQHNIFNPELGGGVLADLGVYCVSLWLYLAGLHQAPAALSGESASVRFSQVPELLVNYDPELFVPGAQEPLATKLSQGQAVDAAGVLTIELFTAQKHTATFNLAKNTNQNPPHPNFFAGNKKAVGWNVSDRVQQFWQVEQPSAEIFPRCSPELIQRIVQTRASSAPVVTPDLAAQRMLPEFVCFGRYLQGLNRTAGTNGDAAAVKTASSQTGSLQPGSAQAAANLDLILGQAQYLTYNTLRVLEKGWQKIGLNYKDAQ